MEQTCEASASPCRDVWGWLPETHKKKKSLLSAGSS